jgi:hypothetical protein
MDKSMLAEEEKKACDTPLGARIHTAQLPPDCEAEAGREAMRVHARYGDLFKNYEEAEYFSMLPLDKAARETVLKRAIALELESKADVNAWSHPCSEK